VKGRGSVARHRSSSRKRVAVGGQIGAVSNGLLTWAENTQEKTPGACPCKRLTISPPPLHSLGGDTAVIMAPSIDLDALTGLVSDELAGR
jgi:hypothetical protein